MHFLNPIWFTALAASSIPVVIHLWNIRPGKTLKVGSISIFEKASPASSRSLKLLDILLLILRCLLLAVVALLLAAPFWQQKENTSAKGWTLVPHNYFDQAYHHYKSKIDSLDKKGYELHYFEAGFPQEKLDELQKTTSSKTLDDTTNYWLLASQLDEKLPKAIPTEIFTPDNSAHFQGNRPGTSHNFNWHTFTPADSVKTQLSKAWVAENGGIRVVQGTGKPSGISYQYTEIKNNANNPLFSIKTANGHASVHLKAADSIQAVVDDHTHILAIYADNNEGDANYLRAALEAASRFMLKKVEVKVYHQPEAIPANMDWLFWLSEAPVQSKNAQHVLYYAGGKIVDNNSWLVNITNNDAGRPQLFKSVLVQKAEESPVWTDASGHIILGRKVSGSNELYPLYIHLAPNWSDLVWSDSFPNWLLQLLTPDAQLAAKIDTRSIAIQQITPRITDGQQASFNTPSNNTNLQRYLWCVLALLFFAERWLSYRNKAQLSNG